MLRPAIAALLGIGATLLLAGSVVYWLLRTGDAADVTDNAALIGALIALGGVMTAQLVSISLEARRAREARALEADRAEEARLQRYLEQVGERLLDSKRPLHTASPQDAVGVLVRAQTSAVAAGLTDPDRKGTFVRFLLQAELIGGDKQLVNLDGVDLTGVNFGSEDGYLGGINLSNAHLMEADLQSARLPGADLSGAKAWRANLRKADLHCINLSGAQLSYADLREAWLVDTLPSYASHDEERSKEPANLHGAILEHARLEGAWLNNANLTKARLHYASLRGAHLLHADLGGAILIEADLRPRKSDDPHMRTGLLLNGTNLGSAHLWMADLRGVNLSKTRGLTQWQISRAIGDAKTTKLPESLSIPDHWHRSPSAQRKDIGPFKMPGSGVSL